MAFPLAMLEESASPAPVLNGSTDFSTASEASPAPASRRLWTPRRVVFTPDAGAQPWGQAIRARVVSLGLPVEDLKNNRLTDLRGADERDTYKRAKTTLAVVNAPASQFELQPIPPSADWQFHLAQGCPAHCQYCYLAGSLSGPPVVRAYANLPQILENLMRYAAKPGEPAQSFEASCYTDPLGIEHLTGSLAETISFFGAHEGMHLRFVTKFDAVEGLLNLPHNGHTRARFSVNAPFVSRRFEGGTATVEKRLAALAKMARAGYPVGIVLAPIMPFDGWRDEYAALIAQIADAVPAGADLTFELITHRFTPGSRETLLGWYPATTLDMDAEKRERKFGKFGAAKYVYPSVTMKEIKATLTEEIAARLPGARVLYFT